MNAAEIVTVYTTNNVVEAGLLKNELEAAGVKTFLRDENTIGAHALLANAIGGVKIQVAASNAEIARQIIRERQQPRTPQSNPQINTGWGICPNCAGKNLTPFREALGWKGVLLLFGLLVVRPKTQLRCNTCDSVWARR